MVQYLALASGQERRLQIPLRLYLLRQNFCVRVLTLNEQKPRLMVFQMMASDCMVLTEAYAAPRACTRTQSEREGERGGSEAGTTHGLWVCAQNELINHVTGRMYKWVEKGLIRLTNSSAGI